MKTLLLLALLQGPYEEAGPPEIQVPAACAELDAKMAERFRVLADAQKARDRAAVRYHDAVEAKHLPKKPTPGQVKAAADEVLAARREQESAEARLALAKSTLESMRAYVTRERLRLRCYSDTPRG